MGVKNYIYRVSFKEAPFNGEGDPAGKTEFFFGSLSSIYDMFSNEQIGCKVQRLWNIKITEETPYIGRKCAITKEPLTRKKQQSPGIIRTINE